MERIASELDALFHEHLPHKMWQLCITYLCALIVGVEAAALTGSSPNTFTNPILNKTGADPWVIQKNGYYYMTYTTNDNITLLRSRALTDWNNAESRLLFSPPADTNYSRSLWAPELHQIGDAWYVIFTADPTGDDPSPEVDMLCPFKCPAIFHRMFVLEGVGGDDPWTIDFSFKAELDTYDQFAIDGTYFQHESGLYHIYSCWDDKYSSWPANLCITKMSNPWTVSSELSERRTISRPTLPWEKTPYGRTVNDRLSSNEAPQQLINPTTGQNFVIYSGGRSDNRNYCLGQLELIGKDPMDLESWRKHEEGPIFYQNPEKQVFGVGHASFTKSPDGSEDWIVYHGMQDPTNGWSARTIRTQKYTWGSSGAPEFPRPEVGPLQVPSGQD